MAQHPARALSYPALAVMARQRLRLAVAFPFGLGEARRMRHATQKDLDRLEGLLARLRELPQLRERKRGYFSRGSRAFLHFHEDAGDLYADVRLGEEFQRMRVTSDEEQAEFLSRVGEAVQVVNRPDESRQARSP
jgi:hypothetical protein